MPGQLLTLFKRLTVIRVLAILTVGVLLALLIWKTDPVHWMQVLVNRDTNPVLFITLMAFLPVVGFPMTVFLILVGIKFGTLYGMLITALTMPVHMILSYFLARTFFQKLLQDLLTRKGYSLPEVTSRKAVVGVFIFLFLPGLSYALKNYLLAITEIRLPLYLAVNLSAQGVVTLPVAGLGGAAAEHNPIAIGLVLALIILVALGRWVYKKKKADSCTS